MTPRNVIIVVALALVACGPRAHVRGEDLPPEAPPPAEVEIEPAEGIELAKHRRRKGKRGKRKGHKSSSGRRSSKSLNKIPKRPAAPPPAPMKLAPHEIELSVVDVGQGDGILLRTGDGHAMVVDTGTRSGGRSLAAHIEAFGVKKIDLLVLTHPHAGIRKQAAGVLSHVMAKQYEWR